MGRKHVSCTFSLLPSQAERLKALSDRTGVPQAKYVRDALDALLDERERELAEREDNAGRSALP